MRTSLRQPSLPYLLIGSFAVLLAGLLVTVGVPALKTPAPTALAVPYTETQLRGRSIYIREGCVGCHSQQVRAIEAEQGTVYQRGDLGPESVPGDYVYQKPVLWGTNRQGPDLSHVSSRLYATKEWHLAHLKSPRALVSGSLMPSFAHLPSEELDALAEYLLTLQ